MEFCPGGDLRVLSQRQQGKYFSEQAARFYVAEILLALEYLHMHVIVYRDLKPENFLVREDGHIMLSDFNLSVRCAISPTIIRSSHLTVDSKNSPASSSYCIAPACMIQPVRSMTVCFSPGFFSKKSEKSKWPSKTKPDSIHHQVTPLPELVTGPTSARSMLLVGTHGYLAPEIIKGEGHGSAVDWSMLGIFLYEVLYGRMPFKGPDNRVALFNVVVQPLRFSDSPVVSFAAQDLNRGLLVKGLHHRLVYVLGVTEIKQHSLFQSVNWALIRCATPPQVPKPFVADVSRMGQKEAGAGVNPSGGRLAADLLIEILLKLPVKSIGRSKNVCKNWLHLIEGPLFIQLHCRKQSSEPRLSLLAQVQRFPAIEDNGKFYTFILKCSREERALVRHIRLPFNVDAYWVKLLGSINGIVCFSVGLNFARLVLWNPTVRKYRIIIPPLPDVEARHLAGGGFIYDRESKDYKILRIVYSARSATTCEAQIQIYSSLSDKWAVKVITGFTPLSADPTHKTGVMARDQLYWFCPKGSADSDSEKIVSFDVCSENFRCFPISPPPVELRSWVLIRLGNCIALMLPKCVSDDNSLDDCLESVHFRILKRSEDEQEFKIHNLLKRVPIDAELDWKGVFEVSKSGEIIATPVWRDERLLLCSEEGPPEDLVRYIGTEVIEDVIHHAETLAWPL